MIVKMSLPPSRGPGIPVHSHARFHPLFWRLCYGPSESCQDSEEVQKFFFFPEETAFKDDGIQYRGYFISYNGGDVECAKIQGQEAFAPINMTPVVRFLLNRSERVQPTPETTGTNRQNFRSLTKACNIYAYRSLKVIPGPASSYTITTSRPPTFLANMSNLEPITPPTFKKAPLLVDHATNSDPFFGHLCIRQCSYLA